MARSPAPSPPSSLKLFTLAMITVVLIFALVAAVLMVRRPAPDGLDFSPVAFADLQGWQDGDPRGALLSFVKSCEKILKRPASRRMSGAVIGGHVRDWQGVCGEAIAMMGPEQVKASEIKSLSQQQVRDWFEQNFTPLSVSLHGNPNGIFTGYYEPLLHGSLTQSDRYHVPLLARPDELVMVDLGAFRSDLKGRRIAGRVVNGRLQPYPDRGAIVDGALENRTDPVIWVDDAVMAFSLHIQGSGRVQLDDGRMMRVGYHAQNGHPYVAIGRVMVKKGYLKRGEVTMPAIIHWLRNNPDKADSVMNANPSYVFLRLYEGDGPFGSAGVALTARRSLAIDRRHLPLNAPIFLSSTHPDPDSDLGSGKNLPFNQLMVTQDTGGAINGAIRGDVFWGYGKQAEAIAGRMANEGRYYLLLPTALAAKKIADLAERRN